MRSYSLNNRFWQDDDRPSLRLPVPEPAPVPVKREEEEEYTNRSRVVVIDMVDPE